MPDGNTGDARAKPVDHPATTTAAVGDAATAKLHADSQARPSDATTHTDATQASDKALDKVRETTEKPAVDAYTHLTKAQVAANEIASYVKADKKDTDTVTVKGDDGVDHTVKVADRVAALKKIVDTECATAVGQSNNIKQADVAQVLQAARNDRNTLAKELGLNPDTMTKASIADARKGTTDSATAAKLDDLALKQARVDTFKLWENAPAYTRMLYASFKAAGLTDPDTGLQRDKNGGLKTSQKDVLDAVQLLSEAGSNKEFRSSRLYVEAVATVLPKLENSSVRVQAITKDLQDATAAGAKGDKVTQEKLLKDAVSQADQTNTAAIAQMLRDPTFVASQRNKGVVQDMANNVVMSSTARLQYAQFLADQGRFGDAQGLVLRVKTECPEVMYAPDPKDPTKMAYNQSRYVDLAKLDQTMATSTNVQPNQIKNLLEDFSTAMSKGQLVSKDGTKGAQDIMNDLYAASRQKVREVVMGEQGLIDAQRGLDQRKADLASKKYLTDGAKKIEQDQIDREQAMIQQQKDILHADSQDAHHLMSVVMLYDAGLSVAEDNREHARDLLATVKGLSPDLAAAKDPDGKDSFYAQMDKAAQEPSFLDKNWRKIATGVAITLGVVAAGLTIWSGPGAILCGAGTTAALMTTMGIAVGTATVAGAAGFVGTHAVLHATGAVSEKVDFMKDVKQGASIGAMTGFMVAMTPLMTAAGTIGATGVATETAVVGTEATAGTAGLVQTSAFATRMASLGRTALVVGTGSVATEGVQHFTDGHTWKQSAETVALYTALPVVGGAAAPYLKGAGMWALRGVGLAKAAPETAAVVKATAYVAPQFFTKTNLLVGGLQLGALQGMDAMTERMKADAFGPMYAFGQNGTVSPYIQNSTAIFGPWNNTRGWDPNRQGSGDGAGEVTAIMGGWKAIEPGLGKTDDMSTETPAAPIVSSKSDFTDASDPGSDQH